MLSQFYHNVFLIVQSLYLTQKITSYEKDILKDQILDNKSELTQRLCYMYRNPEGVQKESLSIVMLNFIHGQQTKSDNSEILSEVEELPEEEDFIIKSQR